MATIKRKSSLNKKKKVAISNTKLQPYSVSRSKMKVLQPSTPGNHFKSFNTNRSRQLSKKKKKTIKKKQ